MKLTVDQVSLLTAVLHYAIESADIDTDEDTVEELKRLCTFFAAVSIEPWAFAVEVPKSGIKVINA